MTDDSLQADLQQLLGAQYALERELPRGGMSRVFVAEETALRRRVVMKVLLPELTATLSAERFKREITLAARLQHPHIVPLLSAGHAGEHLYYTMPLMDGDSLRERIARERPMAIPDIITIVVETARALAYAHEEGVVHRDIKPDNVMFFHGQAVVLDFGIGKALASAATTETEILRITQAGMALGTPTYVAPEQAAGDATLDHRADLYALGVVAYEMITGHPPFAGRNPLQVIEAHRSKKPDAVDARRADVPRNLADIVMKCLEKDPAHRPANGNEIMRVLEPSMPARMALNNPRSVAAWLPWVLAAVSTLLAVVFASLYFARA